MATPEYRSPLDETSLLPAEQDHRFRRPELKYCWTGHRKQAPVGTIARESNRGALGPSASVSRGLELHMCPIHGRKSDREVHAGEALARKIRSTATRLLRGTLSVPEARWLAAQMTSREINGRKWSLHPLGELSGPTLSNHSKIHKTVARTFASSHKRPCRAKPPPVPRKEPSTHAIDARSRTSLPGIRCGPMRESWRLGRVLLLLLLAAAAALAVSGSGVGPNGEGEAEESGASKAPGQVLPEPDGLQGADTPRGTPASPPESRAPIAADSVAEELTFDQWKELVEHDDALHYVHYDSPPM